MDWMDWLLNEMITELTEWTDYLMKWLLNWIITEWNDYWME